MVRPNKWIECGSPTEAVSVTARRALKVRLQTVAEYLPLAAYQADRDVEHVHQLRVATRRALATIDIFEDLLPRRRTRRLAKRLRKVRKAAGDARDLDVLEMRLSERATERTDEALARIVRRIKRLRRRAQRPLIKIERQTERWGYERRVRKLLRRVRPRGAMASRAEPAFRAWAQGRFRATVAEFFSAAKPASKIKDLHRFRIEAKRLRYAIEVCADAMPPALRNDLYPVIESLQEKLGAINDHATAAARYERWLDQVTEPDQAARLRELLEEETSALASEVQAFRRWWNDRRRMELERRFRRLLGKKGGRKRAS